MSFKYKTGNDLEDVMKYLDKVGVPYERRDSAHMLIIRHPTKPWKVYDYRYTTGRWCPLPNKLRKHYCSRDIQDFVEKYLDIKMKG